MVEHGERLLRGARGVAALRLFLACLAISVTVALQVSGQGLAADGGRLLGWHPVYWAAIITCGLDVVYLVLLRLLRGGRGTAAVVASGLAGDVLLGTVLVYLTGGHESAFLPLLFVWIISAGSLFSARMAYAAASLTVMFLSAGELLRYGGVYPYAGYPEAAAGEHLRRAAAFHLAQSGALFTVAYLAGALARHLAAAKLVAKQVLAAMRDGLIVLDHRNRILYSNGEAARLLATDLPGGRDISDPLRGERLETVRRRLVSRQRFGPDIVSLDSPGGGCEFTLALSGSPVLSARGSFQGLVAVISDRSAERQLEEAQRLAEGRRTVAEVAMSIAHEIRNPLAAIRSAVQEIGRERTLSPSGRELAEVVISESDRLDRIVADFLAYARPRPAERIPTELRELAEDTVTLIARSAPPAGGLHIENAVPHGYEVDVDRSQIRQALLNLGLNALGAMLDGGVLRFSARPAGLGEFLSTLSPRRRARQDGALRALPPGTPGVILEVTDNGAGMDAETLGRCGEPFFTTRPDGTGLGLATVERIVAAHGGTINVRSARGSGTAVELWLPRHGGVDPNA